MPTLDLAPDFSLTDLKDVRKDLAPEELYEHVIRNQEAVLAPGGAIVARTGQYTGRSPNDKFIVKDAESEDTIWWDQVHSFSPDQFEALRKRQEEYLRGKPVYVRNCHGGTDPEYRIGLRVVTMTAWHNLFAYNMFVRTPESQRPDFEPDFTIVHTPEFKAVPSRDGTQSEAFVVINFTKRMVLIGGTLYAGEIKKSIFTVLNYLLPLQGVLGMHCSANIGPEGDSALFFGLSGTGKTTLSADPDRALIGDDEHGWSDAGVFNFEGGCYAKVIKLSAEAEPEIHATTRMFGTILENVAFKDGTRELDLDSSEFTENTRASYPIESIPNVTPDLRGGHPTHLIMLTCDAFGVLPPISKLTPEQAMYHFISGYTAKVAGTERGITEPKATFSACFGAPFMALHPAVYAKLLGEKLAKHGTQCWLVNTGWSGGPYGTGSRMKIQHSRAMLHAALEGKLAGVETKTDPVFGLHVPTSCPGVPAEVLWPRNTWASGSDYDAKALHLAQLFHKNFGKYAEQADDAIKNAGPTAK